MEQVNRDKINVENRSLINNIIFILRSIRKDKASNIYFFMGLIISNALVPFGLVLFPPLIIDSLIKEASLSQSLIRIILQFSVYLLFTYCMKRYLDGLSDSKYLYIRFFFLEKYYKKCMNIKYPLTEDPNIINNVQKLLVISNGIHRGISGVFRNLIELIYSLFIAIAFALMLGNLNPYIVIALLLNGFLIYQSQKAAKDYEVKNEDRKTKLSRILIYWNSMMNDSHYGKDSRLYNMKKLLKERTHEAEENYHKFNLDIRKRYIYEKIIDGMLMILREGILYGILTYEVLYHNLSIGDFTMYIIIIRRFTGLIKTIFSNLAFMLSENVYINELRNYLNLDEDSTSELTHWEYLLQYEDYELEFKDVSFSYPNSERIILENINLKICAGERLAVVGKNGEGKSTLIKLLCGFYKPTSGAIYLNSIHIDEIPSDIYYRLISAVFQDIKLFAFSIAENIACTQYKDIDMKEIYRSLIDADIYDKVMSLEKQMKANIDTNLELDGIKLSGGEYQKVAIARSLYKKGKIVIMDEPTSALDPVAEYKIYESFNKLVGNKTAIYVSHRLASTRFCDRIILIGNRQILEEGSHAELMELGQAYYKMFEIQARYYKEDVSEVINERVV